MDPEDSAGAQDMSFESTDDATPERIFNRVWVSELLVRVARVLELEYREAGKEQEYRLFGARIVEPALQGTEPPPLRELAGDLGLAKKQAANRLVTARRAYQRLLRNEIRAFASSADDVAAEVRDLFQFLAAA